MDTETLDKRIEQYRAHWANKTTKQIQKELASWRAHMDKHEAHYKFHGRTAPPDEMTDGDCVRELRDVLRERGESA